MPTEERDRMAELWDAFDRRLEECEDGSAAAVFVTFQETAYPSAPDAVFACHPVSIDADESEGATPTFNEITSQVAYAANLGSAVPPVGSYVLARISSGRWVFTWN